VTKTKTHKDVEFSVNKIGGGEEIFRRFADALEMAIVQSISLGEKWTNVNVLIYSEAGAKWWGGEAALKSYREDPEASVSHRISVKGDDRGRVA